MPLTGWRIDPQIIWETKRRREMGEAAFQTSRRGAPYPCLAFQDQCHVSGQGQVKGKKHIFCMLDAIVR